MKGISTIIAAIILVVITIGLIATAYLYFAGIVSVGAVVSIANAYCYTETASHNVSLTLKNEGTSDWSDLTFLWDGDEVTPVDAACETVDAGEDGTCIFGNFSGDMPSDITGTHELSVIGPRNQAGGPITC